MHAAVKVVPLALASVEIEERFRSACIDSPEAPALDGSGNLYFIDGKNQRLRKLAPTRQAIAARPNKSGQPMLLYSGGVATRHIGGMPLVSYCQL